MKKAALIVGARPQFIKVAPLIKELGRFYQLVLIHTGQHYDFAMSENFFRQLNIPDPDYHLDIQSGKPGQQTGRMIEGLESVLSFERPDFAIVIGDTNSTLAGAIAATKLAIPLVHVEAGVRSVDKFLPEQINRVMTDSIADCFLCPNQSSADNLAKEGKSGNVFVTGDIIYDCLRIYEGMIPDKLQIPDIPDKFALATLHRAEAVDNAENLKHVLDSLNSSPIPVIFPLHPRTRKMIARFNLENSIPDNTHIVEPVGYLEILRLLQVCEFVITDSGGIQREAVYYKKRVILPRPETEWVELSDSGWVTIASYDFPILELLGKNTRELPDGYMKPSAVEMVEKMRAIF